MFVSLCVFVCVCVCAFVFSLNFKRSFISFVSSRVGSLFSVFFFWKLPIGDVDGGPPVIIRMTTLISTWNVHEDTHP